MTSLPYRSFEINVQARSKAYQTGPILEAVSTRAAQVTLELGAHVFIHFYLHW